MLYLQCSTMEIEISRRSLYEMIQESTDRKIDDKLLYMENKGFELVKCPKTEENLISRHLRHFKSDFKKKWGEARNTEDRFIKQNEKWLDTLITIPAFN
jgi:hypothetical protein